MRDGGPGPRAVEQNRGPHLTSVLLIQHSECCTVYRFPPAAARWAASHFRCTVYRPRDGGSWPGAVEQNRRPHLTSALLTQRSPSVSIVVPCTDSHPRRPLCRHRISFRPPLPHRPHCLRAAVESSARTSALLSSHCVAAHRESEG